MQIKMLQSIAGHADPDNDIEEFSFKPGDVVDLKDGVAKAWVAGGLAEAVQKEPKGKKK